jgi:hypothetical protein
MDGERVADLERALAIHETVFRHLLVVREAGDDSEPENGEAAVAGTRQTVVAAADDDTSDSDEDEDDDEPDVLLAANPLEEEN